MGEYLKFVEGNILQFAPLSCIHSILKLDPFKQFILAIVINTLVVIFILLYLVLKKRHINQMEIFTNEKMKKISSLKGSCYRNVFLFLLLSYPVTFKKIIIVPLRGACVDKCFTNDGSNSISLLKADYSIRCFTSQHKDFWHIAAGFAGLAVVFPLLLFAFFWKYRTDLQGHKEIAFGLKVLYENYKEKY